MDDPNNSSAEARLDAAIAAFIRVEEVDGPQKRYEWLARYPEFAIDLAEFLAGRDEVKRLARPFNSAVPKPENPAPDFEERRPIEPPLIPFAAQRERIEVGSIFANEYLIRGVQEGGMGHVYFADSVSPSRGYT